MTHTDDLLDRNENELRDLLSRSMTGTTAPAEIGPQSLRSGRRLRARRRAGLAAGAVAASAVAAIVLPMALGGGSATVVDPAGTPSSAATSAAQDTLPDDRPAGWWDMQATDMVSALEAILPDGVVVTDPGPLTADSPEGGPGIGFVNAFVTAPGGAGRVNVMLYPGPPESVTITPDPGTNEGGDTVVAPDGDHGCDAPEHEGAASCTEIQDGEELEYDLIASGDDISCTAELAGRTDCTQIRDGAGVVVGRLLVTHWGDLVMTEAVLRRNGGTVYAASANTLDDKWGKQSPTSSAVPPLTLDQLEALVRNDTWVKPAT